MHLDDVLPARLPQPVELAQEDLAQQVRRQARPFGGESPRLRAAAVFPGRLVLQDRLDQALVEMALAGGRGHASVSSESTRAPARSRRPWPAGLVFQKEQEVFFLLGQLVADAFEAHAD